MHLGGAFSENLKLFGRSPVKPTKGNGGTGQECRKASRRDIRIFLLGKFNRIKNKKQKKKTS
jgi:hypothetical protein